MIPQERDLKLFSELAHLGLASTEQCQTLAGFTSYSRAKDRLRNLVYGGLLRRLFVGTIHGGQQAVYCLSEKSAALIGVKAPPFRHRQDELVTADQFIRHQLRITAMYLAVGYGTLPQGVSFIRWRRFTAPVTGAIGLIPDGYCELKAPVAVRPMFLEVDMGSESLRIWQRKTELYLQLAVSGEFQRLSGQSQFRVLVLAPTERRLLYIRAKVAAQTSKIFWFASFERIDKESVWSAIWLRPTGSDRFTLI